MPIEASVVLVPAKPVPPNVQITLSVEAAHALQFLVGRSNVGEMWSLGEHTNSVLCRSTTKQDVCDVVASLYSPLGVNLQKVK